MYSEEEEKIASRLTSVFLEYANELQYANLDNNKYQGWVSNFNLKVNGERFKLELNDENDLFLLFVLAIAWSRSGYWENSVYFVAYLKTYNKSRVEYWKDSKNIEMEIDRRKKSINEISSVSSEFNTRAKASFRKDIFPSVGILAQEWDEIQISLANAAENADYIPFMQYVRSIQGLGARKRKILIKIPLILRELRCQGVYQNIPGEFCCVPDKRVLDASKTIGIKLVDPYRRASLDISSLINSSRKIYALFGDLYDIPLFAYEDLKHFV